MATPEPFTPNIITQLVHDFGANSWMCLALAEKPATENEPAHRYLLLSRGYYARKANNEPRRTSMVPIPLDRETLKWLRSAILKLGYKSPAVESFGKPEEKAEA